MTAKTRRRLSADETRERLITAGLSALATSGLSIGLDAVSLEQAVHDSGVSRSSAYASWSTSDDYTPQELFQRTVLKRSIAGRRETISRTQATAVEVIDRLGPDVHPAKLLRELSRATGGVNARSVAESRSWQLVVALRSVLHSEKPGARDDELAEWVSESEEGLRHDTIETIYKPIAERLGIRPKPEFGELAYHYGEIAAAALAEGLAPRYFMRSAEYLEGIERIGPDGENEEWSLFSVVLESIVLLFFEPIDPDSWK